MNNLPDNSSESYREIKSKAKKLEAALKNLASDLKTNDAFDNITFNEFLYVASKEPRLVFRDVFMYFHDMMRYYVQDGQDDYEVTDDSVGFVNYNFDNLFVKGCDNPFFADRLFANRLMNMVNAVSKGIQNNQIILFEGPPGSGKSTFLNNLLNKLETYSLSLEGIMYKSYWKLNVKAMGESNLLDAIIESSHTPSCTDNAILKNKAHIEISCPNNDNPILLIPREHRKKLLDELITNPVIKRQLFNSKAYNWLLREKPCSICSSIYTALLDKMNNPLKVLGLLYAKKVRFDRQFGKGITVYNPGDEHIKRSIKDDTLQGFLNMLFGNDEVRYLYSNLAYTNNGVYALMDIKDKNIERLIDLHGIISDGVHKVEHTEERIKSLFLGLVNPEDKKNYENVKSFQDRIIHVNIPYILDYKSEVMVYDNKFGKEIFKRFLPGVLENFAKIIIATRMNKESSAIKKWLKETKKYKKYVDEYFLLLKMELYKGTVPDWLDDDDKKSFIKPIRKELLVESESEGKKGISGRQSLTVFSKMFSKYSSADNLITMEDVKKFFLQNQKYSSLLPEGFVESVEDLYDYNVLQHVKESLYFYSEKQISRDILNYLFSINYDTGTKEKNPYTGDSIEINESYFNTFENILLGTTANEKKRSALREEIRTEYITYTFSKEIKLDGKNIIDTRQYKHLFDRYIRVIKENVLKPYLSNDNFRLALLDYGTSAYNSHPLKLRKDISRLITRLKTKYRYSQNGAVQVTVYIIDKKIAEKFE